MPRDQQVDIVIPRGTKVLTGLGGRVGIVAHAPAGPDHSYRVRFPDGHEESFRRADLSIFKHVQAEVPGAPDSTDLYRFVIYRCVVGSTAYGLTHEGSDMDRRGFYLPPADIEWSLAGVPEQLETDNEEVYWEIEKFIRLALKANPNILECLYSPLVETCTPLVRGSEKDSLDAGERDFHQAEYARLLAALEKAAAESHLPNEPVARDALNDLLVRVRLPPVEPR